jgi:biofilm PGA synthesis N-glycosyltransferase PgaC
MRTLNIFDYLVIFFGSVNLIRIAIFLVGSDMYSLKSHFARKKRWRRLSQPTVSVIVPAHNEEKTIVRTMRSILKSIYPKTKLELIVIDDGSHDNTYVEALLFKKRNLDRNITLIRQINAGKANALNNAIKNYTHGELIMCLDADSLILPNAIKNAVKYFNDPKIKGLSANVKIIENGTLINFIQKFEYIVSYQMKRAQTLFNIEYIIGGIGSMFRRDVLKEVEYYDTDTLTEDIGLSMKIIKNGNKENRIIYAGDVIAYTESCLTIKALLNQRYRWKWGRCQTFLKNISMFFNTDKKYTKLLTCFYLPFAVYSDITFLFEPIIVGYIVFITLFYRDLYTLLSAFIVLSSYIGINVLAEDTIPLSEKMKLIIFVPIMYFLFYVLSYVEYVALIRSVLKLHKLKESISKGICNWQHVERTTSFNLSRT